MARDIIRKTNTVFTASKLKVKGKLETFMVLGLGRTCLKSVPRLKRMKAES